jgi:glycosyltransferase involved in cell wall biosynthesis
MTAERGITSHRRPVLPRVSVVVPAYNEARLVERTLEAVCEYLDSLGPEWPWEVLVVDDGSSDATGELAEAFASRHAGVRVLRHRVNFNLGQALRYAFNNCQGDYIVTLDSDLSYDPSHIGRLLEEIERSGARIVVASPYMKGGRTVAVPLVRRVASRAANRFLSVAARGQLATLTGMVRAYDRRFLRTLDLRSTGPEINVEVLYKASIVRARVIEVPATLDWSYHGADPRRGGALPGLVRATAKALVSGFLFRPVAFLALPGSLLFLASVVALLAGRPTAAVVFLLLGVQILSLGILALQSTQYFADSFHLGTTTLRRLDELGRVWDPGDERSDDPEFT